MLSARPKIARGAASRSRRLALLALCGAIGSGALTGCETTQEKAAAQQAESKRILEARAKRQKEKKTRNRQKHEKGKG